MSEEQRHFFLDNPENYPVRVAFLGKRGLLTSQELRFLRGKGVDFDVDDHQIAEMEAETLYKGKAIPPPRQSLLLTLVSMAISLFLILRRSIHRRATR